MHAELHSLQGATRLADWGVLRASGADTLRFLNGQLTQQLSTLPEGVARLAGYCSPKGRLLASLVVWRSGADEVLLACSADLLAATARRLSMFVLRAKCRIEDASSSLPIWGLAGDVARDWLGATANDAAWSVRRVGSAWAIALPGGAGVSRWLWVAPAGESSPPLPALEPAHWLALEALSGVPRVVAATAEQFVPQMVNLELVGGVDFQKGCYTGQEVVARSQYRGTLKRRMFLFECDAPATPGQELFHSDDPGQPAGMVVIAGALDKQSSTLLAEVKLAALAGGSLHLGRADGPALRRAALPYAVPEPETT
ncbi:MAG: folate-binding protein [Burkholderiaceae bacterium]